MRIEDQADSVTFTCKSPNQEKVSDYKIKLTELAQVVFEFSIWSSCDLIYSLDDGKLET